MANNDYITTDCKLTVSKNTAKLDEEIFLYKNDRNIKLLIEIVDNKYRYKSDDLSNLLVKYKASYAQVKWYKNAEVKKEFPIQATDDGKVVFVIEGQLIDEDTELGDYDLQLRLLNESQESIRSLPIIKGAVHILKPLFEEGDIATVNSAVADVSMLSLDGDAIDTYNSDGTYNQTNWGNGDVISSAKLNKLEKVAKDNVDKVNKMPAKSIVEGGKIYLAKEDGTKLDSGTELPAGGTGTSYDDTEIKTDINTIKTELGTDTLTTTAQNLKGAINEVNKKIGTGTGTTPTVNSVEPVDGDIPRVFFNGEKPTSKTAVHATIEYKSKTEHFKGYVEIKCQGTSSMSYPKKNYTIKMFKDSTMAKKVKKDFKGWGEQSKFCLKANYIDHSHARNICAAKLWNQIVTSRANYTLLPELLRTSPCNGAIDGFPIKVYYNNNYEGVYTWNIPKDKWMFNMDDTLDNHCVLCGEEYNSGCFLSANARLWSDEIHDTMPASIVTSFNAFQNFVISSSDDEFKANLENYVYVDSLIDYYIFQYVICGLDSMGKNQLFATYDGTKWIATSYDMDSTFGIYWNGQKFVAPTYRMQDDYESVKNGAANKLYVRLEKLFVNEIKARYSQLRADILSYNNIVNTFEPFMDTIGNDLYAEDLTIYSGIPSGSTNNIQQIRNYYRDRVTYVDAQIDKLVSAIACTNITLNKTELTFTTDVAQTLTATLTPTDTTDKVVWSVSPTGFATVNNGVVTPVNNGTCVITATCGTQKATCNVTVNLPVEAVTALNLDKDSITLGNSAEVDTNNVSKFEDALTATLTPANATNKNVTWTANNENVQLVANGLNCTVKAKAVGNSIVTCTSQDTTNGTIADTCNVTVNAIPEQPAALYTLPQEKVFNGTSDYVDTGVQLFKTDQDFTITLDVTPDTQTSTNVSLIHCMKEASPYPGIVLQTSAGTDYFALSKGNNDITITNLVPLEGRTKLVMVKNGTTMKVYTSNNIKGESPYTFTAIDQTLLLGAYQDVNGNKGRFFKGTVHEFSIIKAVYTNEQINAYLGVAIAAE